MKTTVGITEIAVCHNKRMKKLAHYAKQHNVTYHTAWNHFHAGLIENAYQLPNGTIVIPDSTQLKPQQKDYIITYARVSSSERLIKELQNDS